MLTQLREFINKIPFETNAQEVREQFAILKASFDTIKMEVAKAYTLPELKKKIYARPGAKKEEIAKDYAEALFGSFRVKDGLFSYTSFTFGANGVQDRVTYLDALEKDIQTQTDEHLQAYRDKVTARRAEIEKAKTNPETIEEFKIYLRSGGTITPELTERYESLFAAKTLGKIQEEKARKATISVNVTAEFSEIIETKHTQKGHDLFVVQLSERVEKDEYTRLNTAAKQLKGYYSSYKGSGAIPGFTFTEKENAEKFVSLKNGAVKANNKVREEIKTALTANKFLEMAERLNEAGQQQLNQDRKVNTHRRASMAANAERQAVNKIYWGKVLKALAERELVYLKDITALTQLRELDSILSNAHHARASQLKKWDIPRDFEEDLPFVKFPYLDFHKEAVKEWALKLYKIKGQKMRGERIWDRTQRTTGDLVRLNREDVETIQTIFKDWRVESSLTRLNRLEAANIPDLAVLKMALRELNAATSNPLSEEEQKMLKIKALERQFIGKKIDGFFPTPSTLVNQMIEWADIQEGDIIREPSAGLGHIADAVKANFSNELYCLEINQSLAEALKEKGHDVSCGDFLESDEKADVFLMNPPFENCQDITHVKHAYSLLNEGGNLVAIMANRGYTKGNPNSNGRAFYEWLNGKDYEIEDNPEGSFLSAFNSTGVNTVMIKINK